MNDAALNELRSNLSAVVMALEAEGLHDVAKIVHRDFGKYLKAVGKADAMPPIDWTAVVAQLQARAGAMTKENMALTPAARNTPFGIMTGTATIVLDMLAEAIAIGVGLPAGDRIDEMLAAIRGDRAKLIMDRATKTPR